MNKIETLKKFELFHGLNEENLNIIASACQEEQYEIGEAILKEDTPGSKLYMISEGEVYITINMPVDKDKNNLEDKEAFIASLGPGEVLGEMALVDGRPRSANAKALSIVKLLVLSYDDFMKIVEKDYKIGFLIMRNIAKLISERLREDNLALKYSVLWG